MIESYFTVNYVFEETDRGLSATFYGRHGSGSYRWDAPLKDYNDFDKLSPSRIVVDYERTKELYNLAFEVMGDILEIRLSGAWWWSLGKTWNIVELRGLGQFMMDLINYPEEVHKAMEFFCNEDLAKLDFLEQNGLLTLNNDGPYVGSGGFGYTNHLPQENFEEKRVRTWDMWGFSESQETIGISPAMFEEFVFPYQVLILKRFGLNCYGCCEPLDNRWDVIKKIPRLRRVSVSPWANVSDMAEKLGDRYIFSWKLSPVDLACPEIDKEYIRKKLRQTIRKTRNCHVEIIMKDNHTICGNPENVINWSCIAKEEAESI